MIAKAKIAALLALLSLLGCGLWWAGAALYAAGQKDVRVRWDADVVARGEATRRAEEAARVREQTMAASFARRDKEKHDAQIKLVADYAAVVASLLSRPDRPGPDAGAAGAGRAVGCTGAELYRPDGEFLAREAARAEGVRLQLKSCQGKYDEVRKAVNGWSPSASIRSAD